MIQVFSKEWFELHQSKLLKLANSRLGRRLLRIHGHRSHVGKNKITKILPNAIFWTEGAELKAEFRTNDKFGMRLYYGLKPFWFMLHGWDFVFGEMAKELDFGFLTLTQYPGSVTTYNPVSGYVQRSNVDESFSTIRAGAGNGADGAGTQMWSYIASTNTGSNFTNIRRSIMCFDTSALTAAAGISAATISLCSTGGGGGDRDNGLGNDDVHICGATPASTTALANSDYGQVQATTFGSLTYAGITSSVYNAFTLNSNGIAAISLTGISKFGVRGGWDLNNSFGGVWSASKNSFVLFYSAGAPGTSQDPMLVVTYGYYTATKNLAQSLNLASTNADILTAEIQKTDSLPAGTNINYAVSGDFSTFQAITPVTPFSEQLWSPIVVTGSGIKWQTTLSGSNSITPVITQLVTSWTYGVCLNATTVYGAQSFTPAQTANVQRLDLYAYAVGSPGNITVRIETDNSNAPSGALVNANATATIAPPVAGAWGWLSFGFPAAFSVTSGTKYWIVVKAAATLNNTNKYLIRGNNNRYVSGDGAKSTNSGSTYTIFPSHEDLMFQMFQASGGSFAANVSLDYVKRYL